MVTDINTAKSKQGVFSKVLHLVVSARERQVRSMVNQHLLMLDDATLKASGYDRAKIIKAQRELIG